MGIEDKHHTELYSHHLKGKTKTNKQNHIDKRNILDGLGDKSLHLVIILTFNGWRQEDYVFESSHFYTIRPYLANEKKKLVEKVLTILN